MQFESTRGKAPLVSLSEAIRNGAAPDGGLYMPVSLPALDWSDLDGGMDLAEFASVMLRPFFSGDALEEALPELCREAFDFPVPILAADPGDPRLRALELFHGPTGAFKDFGARFLMACFDHIGDPAHPLTVLAATSGDTGGAVGCAAEGRSAVRATILYPRGRVSPFQERQLTCWGNPVRAIEVDGDFDDCQRLVKAAFADPQLSARLNLTSANSINFGRLMPQMAYSAHAAVRLYEELGEKPGFIIPTGNLGHGFAALYARAMGAPIGDVILATNANRTLSEWQAGHGYNARPSVQTIANAMDVGAPSNFERLLALPPSSRQIRVELVEDDSIQDRIVSEYGRSGYIWCPHSATAVEAYHRLGVNEGTWVAAATAHPFKFADVIEPIIGATIDPPPALAAINDRKTTKVSIPADLAALVDEIEFEPSLVA